MPKRAKQYVFAIGAAGCLTLTCAAALWICQSPIRFFACLCLTALASTFKVKLPGMDGCISPSLVPLLFAAGTMSWQETFTLAALAGVLQTLWKPKGRPQAIQVLFNGANLSLSMGCAYAISHGLAPSQILVQLGIAAVVYEVLDTPSVSTVIQLIGGGSLAGIWRNCHLCTFPYHLAGVVVASLWMQTDLAMGLSLTVLGAVALYLMNTCYQELVNRAAPSNTAQASLG